MQWCNYQLTKVIISGVIKDLREKVEKYTIYGKNQLMTNYVIAYLLFAFSSSAFLLYGSSRVAQECAFCFLAHAFWSSGS